MGPPTRAAPSANDPSGTTLLPPIAEGGGGGGGGILPGRELVAGGGGGGGGGGADNLLDAGGGVGGGGGGGGVPKSTSTPKASGASYGGANCHCATDRDADDTSDATNWPNASSFGAPHSDTHAIRSSAVDRLLTRTTFPLFRRTTTAVGRYSATWPAASTVIRSVTSA
jgi:hypothetical protein